MICEGCGSPLNPVEAMMTEASTTCKVPICMACVRARHKAVLKRRCSCGKGSRPSQMHRMGSRTWTSCLRCLGTIKQHS